MPVWGEDNFSEVISALEVGARRLVENSAEDAYEAQQYGWQYGVDAMGNPWAPNAPATIRKKGGAVPLIDTEEMREDFDYGTKNIDSGAEARIGPTTRRAGKLIQIHEFGVPEMNIPARPVLEPTARYLEYNIDTHVDDSFDRPLDVALR